MEPVVGEPRSREVTTDKKEVDREARLTISVKTGHKRSQVKEGCQRR
jgi:hypothetical protein